MLQNSMTLVTCLSLNERIKPFWDCPSGKKRFPLEWELLPEAFDEIVDDQSRNEKRLSHRHRCHSLFYNTHTLFFAVYCSAVTSSQVSQPRKSDFNCHNRTLPPRIRRCVVSVFAPGKRMPSSFNCIPMAVVLK